MSWNDYYRFRYSLLPSTREFSELPGLRGWISGWGILFVVAVAPLSGLTGIRTNLTGGYVSAFTLTILLWFVAALGEYFPRLACWTILAMCVGAFGLTIWAWPSILERSWNFERDRAMLVLFLIFPVVVAYRVVVSLRDLKLSSAA